MDPKADQHTLEGLLRAQFPLVTVETHEERRALTLIERVCNLHSVPLFIWDAGEGLGRGTRRTEIVGETMALPAALRHVARSPQNGAFVFVDAHPYLSDPVIARQLKNLLNEASARGRTVFLLGPELALPSDLRRLAIPFLLSPADQETMRRIIAGELDLAARAAGHDAEVEPGVPELLAQHLAGLGVDEGRRLARQAIRADGRLDRSDLRRALQTKSEMLGGDAVVSLELASVNFSDVGGQVNLKRWLARRQPAFVGGVAGLDVPKGLLLLGVQGAGKSLAARAVAGAWGVPLVRLEFGALYSKWAGESERNLRQALAKAQQMSPCVLWLDEIEKGLAADGGDEGGAVSRRLLATLLTWMSERTARVFLVATANEISGLPPELIRKGRFDEVFFVDLPTGPVREEILRIHLARRGHDPAAFDLGALAACTEGFSGAELEQIIVSGAFLAHEERVALASRHLVAEAGRTHPLSATLAERIRAQRDWADGRAVRAD